MCYKETLLQVTGHQGSKVESREREREMKEGREYPNVTGLGYATDDASAFYCRLLERQ